MLNCVEAIEKERKKTRKAEKCKSLDFALGFQWINESYSIFIFCIIQFLWMNFERVLGMYNESISIV